MDVHVGFTSEAEYRTLVKHDLDSLLAQVDEIESDDHDPRISGGGLQVVFAAGDSLILSPQPPLQEIWLSADYTAWHFRYDGSRWIERDSSEPMIKVLNTLFSAKLGMEIRFDL